MQEKALRQISLLSFFLLLSIFKEGFKLMKKISKIIFHEISTLPGLIVTKPLIGSKILLIQD